MTGIFDKDIRLIVAGDISFMGRRSDTPSMKVFKEFEQVFNASDLVVANLESPLLDSGTAVPGKCALHGATGWAAVLRRVGIKVVSLANNHVMDYGPEGLESTMTHLQDA